MRFRIGAMGGKISGNGVDFFIHGFIHGFQFKIHKSDLFTQFFSGIPDFLAKNPMSFNDNVQFVLGMFGLDSNLMAELRFHFFFEVNDDPAEFGFNFFLGVNNDLFETFEIVTIHY